MSNYLQYVQFADEGNETWRAFIIAKAHTACEGSMTSPLVCLVHIAAY